MTLFFTDNLFEKHRTGFHPECPDRLIATTRYLESIPWFSELPRGRITSTHEELIARTHSRAMIEKARTTCDNGGGHLDEDTFVSAASFGVSLHAAGTALAAVDQVLGGQHKNAFALLRPPGHHATDGKSMGFCVFNNIAIAAHYARDVHGLQRVLIVDFDVHHGNGTQDIFYRDAGIHFYSIHRFPFYPGTGTAEETGSGPGLGSTRNRPLPFGTTRQQYLDAFRSDLDAVVAKSKPELILISAGFDAHKDDPVGSLGLEVEDYHSLTRWICEAAEASCGGRVVSCLEGGYNLDLLPRLVEAHLSELKRAALPLR